MRYGVVVPIHGARRAMAAGFDFVEVRAPDLAIGDDDRWLEVREHLEGVPVDVVSAMMPASLPIVGPEPSDAVEEYLVALSERMTDLGAEVVVLGSGAARSAPPEFDPARAEAQLRAFLQRARQLVPHVAVEPLNRTESRVINTVSEALAYGDVILDTYHAGMTGEPLSALIEAREHLVHVQTSGPGRRPPADLRSLFAYLNAIGYDSTVSLECSFDDFDQEGPAALQVLRDGSSFAGQMSFEGETFYTPPDLWRPAS
jgi:sugar phosphate isomerase/epimerase